MKQLRELLVNECGLSESQATTVIQALVAHDMVREVYIPSSAVETLCSSFKTLYGLTKISRYDRFAAHRLIKRYGLIPMTNLITALHDHQADTYCPVVNGLVDVERKLPAIRHFIEKQSIDNIDIML